jgi:hypothetical protein
MLADGAARESWRVRQGLVSHSRFKNPNDLACFWSGVLQLGKGTGAGGDVRGCVMCEICDCAKGMCGNV